MQTEDKPTTKAQTCAPGPLHIDCLYYHNKWAYFGVDDTLTERIPCGLFYHHQTHGRTWAWASLEVEVDQDEKTKPGYVPFF